MQIDEIHHDIISYYDSFVDEDCLIAVCDDDDEKYVEIFLNDDNNSTIVIENGRWYFA